MEAVGAGWRIYGVGSVYRVNAKARACLHHPPSFFLFLSCVISFLPMASLFVCIPCTLSDASCSADQRDFCLKHDLSLKYLKPDYLWVCHLGRRDVTPAGQWQDPPLLSFSLFSPRAMRLCRWNPTPLNSLYERETLPRPLLSLSYPLHRRRASYNSPSNAMKFDTFPL